MKQTVWTVALCCALAGFACGKKDPPEISQAEATEGKEGMQPAQQVACGKTMCALGEVCCNPSCGICTARDGMCTQQFCDDAPASEAGETPPESPKITCDNVRCKAGTHCEMVQVQCVRAPCEPVPECKEDGLLNRDAKDAEPEKK